jgi:hypothetical protein
MAKIKKAQNGAKTIGPNKYAKEQILNPKKKKAYVASNTGSIYSIDNNRMQTIDTTGYSKGKPTYELKEKGKSTSINRKDVLPLLSTMKKKAKMQNGGSLSGLTASTKRVGPSDKGAFIKVQKKTLAGAKGKASLNKDKQLGATKMKMGGKMKKC